MRVTYVKYTTKLIIVATTECLNNIAKGKMDPKVEFSHQINFITSCPKSHCAKNFNPVIQYDECIIKCEMRDTRKTASSCPLVIGNAPVPL